MSLTCLAVLFSVLLRARAGAAPASFGLYLVAWVMQLVVSLGFPFSATIDGKHLSLREACWCCIPTGVYAIPLCIPLPLCVPPCYHVHVRHANANALYLVCRCVYVYEQVLGCGCSAQYHGRC